MLLLTKLLLPPPPPILHNGSQGLLGRKDQRVQQDDLQWEVRAMPAAKVILTSFVETYQIFDVALKSS